MKPCSKIDTHTHTTQASTTNTTYNFLVDNSSCISLADSHFVMTLSNPFNPFKISSESHHHSSRTSTKKNSIILILSLPALTTRFFALISVKPPLPSSSYNRPCNSKPLKAVHDHNQRTCHSASHHITSHHITSHHITSHHITSHHITSHHITSHHITSHQPNSNKISPKNH